MSLLILVGPPGALVAETAAEISRLHGIPFADTDAAIESLTGESAEFIAVERSEEELRRLERDVALAFLTDINAQDKRVLALGSGSLGNSRGDAEFAPVRSRVAQLREAGAVVVHLTGNLATLVHRTGLDGPRLAAVASPRRIFFTQLSQRTPLYQELATHTVDTSGQELAQVTAAVVAAWNCEQGANASGETS
ncbi:MAG: shikimate kinase [Ancrocorticia sp.]